MNSKTSEQKFRILIDLDALIDTRLGLVRKLYPDVADDLKKNKAYRMRKDDQLHRIDPRIDPVDYTFEYAKRDIELLDTSFSSLMIGYMHKLIEKLQFVINGNNPMIQDAKIVINTYPYNLEDEQAKLIALATSTAIGLSSVVDTAYLPHKDVTLDFLEQNQFMAYILYDFNAWTTASLPDVAGTDLNGMGLRRYENITIFAAKLALDSVEEEETRKGFADYGMADMYDEMILIPWNLLFELEFLDPIFFTEYDQQLSDHLMSFVEKSNNPIDLEVGLIADFYHLMGLVTTTKSNIATTTQRMVSLATELVGLANATSVDDINRMRILLAEQRFLVDSLSFLIPSQPSLDFERYMDSTMSNFDISMENSEISENRWNSQGVPCRRIVRNVKSLGKEAYILLCAEDCTDLEGVFRSKNTLLPSVMCFETILEVMPESELNEFLFNVAGE